MFIYVTITMSKTLEIIESINNLMENDEEFNDEGRTEAAYEEYQKLKWNLEDNIWYMVGEVRKYNSLMIAAAEAKKEVAARHKLYKNQAERWKSFLDYIMQLTKKKKLETWDYRIVYRKSTKAEVVEDKKCSLPDALRTVKLTLGNITNEELSWLVSNTEYVPEYTEDKSELKSYVKANDKAEQYETLEEALEKEASLWEQWLVYEGSLYDTETQDKLGSVEELDNIQVK